MKKADYIEDAAREEQHGKAAEPAGMASATPIRNTKTSYIITHFFINYLAITTMRKIYFSLLTLTLMMLGGSAMAQADYTAVINVDPVEGFVAGQKSFDPAEVAAKLGCTVDELAALLNAETKNADNSTEAVGIMQGEEMRRKTYTADPYGYWMTNDGTVVDYGETATWFASLNYEPAGSDPETGETWEASIDVIVGQKPGVFAKVYEASSLKCTLYLINGDKQVSFDITQNITAAVPSSLPAPPTSFAALEVVGEYTASFDLTEGKQYEGKTLEVEMADIYTQLGVEADDLNKSIADVIAVRTYNQEQTGETFIDSYQLGDALMPYSTVKENTDGGTDGWFGRYSYINDKDEDVLYTLNAPRSHGTGATFYLQSPALSEGKLTLTYGQFGGTMAAGAEDYVEFYICNGTKAVKLTLKANVEAAPVIDPSTMVKVEEELTITVVQEPALSGYPSMTYTFDVARVAELLECEVSDLEMWKVWQSEGVMVDNSDNGGYTTLEGLAGSWSAGDPLYIQDGGIAEGKVIVGQYGGRECFQNVTKENPLTINAQLLFVKGQKYVVVNVNFTAKLPDDPVEGPDSQFDIVKNLSIYKVLVPLAAGQYYGGQSDEIKAKMEYDLGIDNIKELIGEGTYEVYGLRAPSKAGEYPRTTTSTGYAPNTGFNGGFWMSMPVESLGEEYANTAFVGGWGTNSYGIEWKLNEGIFGFDVHENQNKVGEKYESTFYWVNTTNNKAIKYTVRVEYAEDYLPTEDVELTEAIEKKVVYDGDAIAIDVDAIYERLGIEGGDLTTQVASGANTYIDYLTYSNTSGFITAEGYMLDIESGDIPEGSATMTIDDVTWDAITYTPNDEAYFAEGTGNIAKILLAFDYTYTDETEATKTKRVPYIISVMGQDTYTGIDSVKADKTAKKGIYNLAGQKVNNAYKGIVIENGRKVLRK